MNIYMDNLPRNVGEQEIRDLLSKFGYVEEVKILTDAETGIPRGGAFIMFEEEVVDFVINELNQTKQFGNIISVKPVNKGMGGRSRREPPFRRS